jgi:hypothetical protein
MRRNYATSAETDPSLFTAQYDDVGEAQRIRDEIAQGVQQLSHSQHLLSASRKRAATAALSTDLSLRIPGLDTKEMRESIPRSDGYDPKDNNVRYGHNFQENMYNRMQILMKDPVYAFLKSMCGHANVKDVNRFFIVGSPSTMATEARVRNQIVDQHSTMLSFEVKQLLETRLAIQKEIDTLTSHKETRAFLAAQRDLAEKLNTDKETELAQINELEKMKSKLRLLSRIYYRWYQEVVVPTKRISNMGSLEAEVQKAHARYMYDRMDLTNPRELRFTLEEQYALLDYADSTRLGDILVEIYTPIDQFNELVERLPTSSTPFPQRLFVDPSTTYDQKMDMTEAIRQFIDALKIYMDHIHGWSRYPAVFKDETARPYFDMQSPDLRRLTKISNLRKELDVAEGALADEQVRAAAYMEEDKEGAEPGNLLGTFLLSANDRLRAMRESRIKLTDDMIRELDDASLWDSTRVLIGELVAQLNAFRNLAVYPDGMSIARWRMAFGQPVAVGDSFSGSNLVRSMKVVDDLITRLEVRSKELDMQREKLDDLIRKVASAEQTIGNLNTRLHDYDKKISQGNQKLMQLPQDMHQRDFEYSIRPENSGVIMDVNPEVMAAISDAYYLVADILNLPANDMANTQAVELMKDQEYAPRFAKISGLKYKLNAGNSGGSYVQERVSAAMQQEIDAMVFHMQNRRGGNALVASDMFSANRRRIMGYNPVFNVPGGVPLAPGQRLYQ